MVRRMPIDELRLEKPFYGLFPIRQDILQAIADHMARHGYDESQPVVIWEGRNIVVDGNTRVLAAKRAGIREIPVFEMRFNSEEDALMYAIHNQRDRRNLTDAEILACIEALNGCWVSHVTPNKCLVGTKQISRTLGISKTKAAQAKIVFENADVKLKEQIKRGEKSIRQAYEEIKEQRKHEPRPVFNLTNEKIEWAKWTWNPVTGCKHGCRYCYARRIAERIYPEKFEPTFHPERLNAPFNMPKPKKDAPIGERNVFVCSMGDLFGDWVPREWIEAILNVVRQAKEWNFLFLTKNPKRLTEFEFPENAWVGTTVDRQFRVPIAEEAFEKVEATIKFVSCEPLLEPIKFNKLHLFDWLIIGGCSVPNRDPIQPEWSWVESLLMQAREAGCMVYFKPNLTVRPKEYPEMRN